jgi:predicted dithiol-disulfide oxidoreductase (DUF899 family)
MMGHRAGSTLAVLAIALQLAPAAAAVECTRADFEAVVDEAAASLRNLNQKNRPVFQEKLRALKNKRGWSHDVFMKEAVPFVKDEKIEVYDQSSAELLDEISRMGQAGAEAATPDCALLEDLRARMSKLVGIQTDKWSYMFGKLQVELAK